MSECSLVHLRLRFDQSKMQLIKHTSLVWTKQPGCRHCCVHVKAAPSCICGDKTRLSRPHTHLHNTGFISYCVECRGKKVQTSSADISSEKSNISWRRGEGGDGECVRGDNAEECVQMGRGLIHTLTHSWKPDCSSPAEGRAYYSNRVAKK